MAAWSACGLAEASTAYDECPRRGIMCVLRAPAIGTVYSRIPVGLVQFRSDPEMALEAR